MLHPRFAEAVRHLRPDADFKANVLIQNDGDGPLLKHWGLSGSPPTDEEIEAALVLVDNPPKMIALDILQARIEAEGAWDTYVNFVFGTAARRNQFLRIMFIGKPVNAAGNALRTSLASAGLTQAQIDRILA